MTYNAHNINVREFGPEFFSETTLQKKPIGSRDTEMQAALSAPII